MLKRSVLKVSTFLMLLLSVVMVFAACDKMEFKVDFIVDDAVYATINTNGEEVLKMPNDPEKDGYVFDGWYWDKDSWKSRLRQILCWTLRCPAICPFMQNGRLLNL